MKIFNSLIPVSVAVLLFATCTNEIVGENPDSKAGEPATLALTFAGNASKTVAPPLNSGSTNFDNEINSVVVFFFRDEQAGNAVFDVPPTRILNPGNTIPNISVTTALKRVYVIANLSAIPSINEVYNLKTLRAYLADASSQVYKITNPSVYQCGIGQVNIPNANTPSQLTSTVQMHFVPARIEVVVETGTIWDTNNVNNPNTSSPAVGTYNGETKPYVNLTEVVVVNAKKNSYFFNSSFTGVGTPELYYFKDSPSNAYYSGLNNNSYASWGSPTNTLQASYANAIPTKISGNSSFFYIFANNPPSFNSGTNVMPTYIAIKGKYYPNDGTNVERDIFYSVALNGSDGNKIENGKAYKLTLTLNGNPKSGGGGSEDPTAPLLFSDFSVTLSSIAWSVKSFNVEI